MSGLDRRLRKAERVMYRAYHQHMGKLWKEGIEASGAQAMHEALSQRFREARKRGLNIPDFFMPGNEGRDLAWIVRTDPEARRLFNELVAIQKRYLDSRGGIFAKPEKS